MLMSYCEIFLDHCAAFRLQVGQLVIQEVEFQIAEQEILIACASLVHCCAVKNVVVASQLYDVADVQFTVE